jgi:hypothetical protein
MLGYSEAAQRLHEDLDRDPNERIVAERIHQRLSEVPTEQLEAWRREGAAMTDAAAFRLVLAAGTPSE